MSQRLQGKAFQQMRPSLKMVSWCQSENGHIRANFADKKSGKKYHHWLNPVEQAKFELVKQNYKYQSYDKRGTVQ